MIEETSRFFSLNCWMIESQMNYVAEKMIQFVYFCTLRVLNDQEEVTSTDAVLNSTSFSSFRVRKFLIYFSQQEFLFTDPVTTRARLYCKVIFTVRTKFCFYKEIAVMAGVCTMCAVNGTTTGSHIMAIILTLKRTEMVRNIRPDGTTQVDSFNSS